MCVCVCVCVCLCFHSKCTTEYRTRGHFKMFLFFFQDLQPNLFGTSKQSDRLSVSVQRLVRLYVILEERERNKKQETRNKKQGRNNIGTKKLSNPLLWVWLIR